MTEAIQRDIVRVQRIWADCREQAGDGPWLFGRFSIADAMFAPVASRFRTYGVELAGTARDYAETVLGSAAYLEWAAAGRIEPEVIEEDEAGLVASA